MVTIQGQRAVPPPLNNEYSKERGQSLKLIIRGQLVRKFEPYQSLFCLKFVVFLVVFGMNFSVTELIL